jgi:hypothetical protein
MTDLRIEPSQEPSLLSTGTWKARAGCSSAIRTALQAHLRGAGGDTSMHRALSIVCRETRGAGVRVEQLIIAVKQAWWSIPETREVADTDESQRALDRIVSACISEYYADRADVSTGSNPTDVGTVDRTPPRPASR